MAKKKRPRKRKYELVDVKGLGFSLRGIFTEKELSRAKKRYKKWERKVMEKRARGLYSRKYKTSR